MMKRVNHTEFRLALLQWVVLPVFILHALVPLGFMPDVNTGSIVICSGYEAKEIPGPHDARAAVDQQPCAFSGIANGLAAQPATVTPAQTIAHTPYRVERDQLPARISRNYQTRAPPAA